MPGAKKGCGAVIKNVLISFEDKDMFCKPFYGPVMAAAVSSPQHGENTAFFSGVPSAGYTAKAFCLSFWSFKEKSINHFL